MSKFFKSRKQQIINEKIQKLNTNNSTDDDVLVTSLTDNINTIKKLFEYVDTVKYRTFGSRHDKHLKFCIIYTDGVVDSAIINDNIISALINSAVPFPGRSLMETLMEQVLQVNGIEKADKLKDIAEAVAGGDTVLLAEGEAEALILTTQSFQTRAIDEPGNERTISGPKEGFTESLLTNLSLLRRKVRSPDLKMRFYTFGRRTQTKACICYFGELADKNILDELYRRLAQIDIDAVLDTNYISEFIKDSRWSLFRSNGYTEKPDSVIGKLLEGRIALLIDGSPKALTVPFLFIENFQSGEDYYLNYYYTSFTRLLRIFGFLISVSAPALYIAIVAFHHEMLPTALLVSIAADRQSVPLPAVLEAVIMLIVFDLMRETGVRMPGNVGHALSILGALVIGQAAVEAKLVSAPMIVLVGITGITNLLVPKLNSQVIISKFFLLFLSAGFGFFGFMIGAAIVTVHVFNQRSFGIPQITLSGSLKPKETNDSFIRAPWWKMALRPKFAQDRLRLNEETKGQNQ